MIGKISFKIGIYNLIGAVFCMTIILLPIGKEVSPIQWLFFLPSYIILYSVIPALIGMALGGVGVYLNHDKKKALLGIGLNLFYILLFLFGIGFLQDIVKSILFMFY